MSKMIYGIFFGDSITYGEYDGVFGGWVDILKRYALKKYREGKNELILFNLGIGGETTEGLLARIHPEMAARNSSDGNIVFIGYGANDLAVKNKRQAVGDEQFKSNIIKAVQQAKQYAEDLYLISILPVSQHVNGVEVGSGKLRTNANVLKYNSIIEEICNENNLHYIDFYSEFVDDKEALLSNDGVHPNEKGYKLMAEIAKPIIDIYLE